MAKKIQTVEQGLLLLHEKAKEGPLSLKRIFHILSGKGKSLILVLLSLPFCQPIQIPGLSMPFGLLISFFGLRLIFGRHVWLPKKLLAKKISSQKLKKITKKGLKIIKKIKFLFRPRLLWFCHFPVMKIMNGVMIVILGIFMALPIPIPLSNMSAAWGVFLIALGIVEDDGLFVLIGYLVSLMTIVFLVGAIIVTGKLFNMGR